MKWELTVPEIPPPLNHFLSRMHYMKRKQEADYWHHQFASYAKANGWPAKLPTPVRVEVVEYCVPRYLRDCDSAVIAAKFCLDGLVRAGFLPDDSPTEVTEVRLRCEPSTSVSTKVTVHTLT